jgi:small-conductance mechanosensitive channel
VAIAGSVSASAEALAEPSASLSPWTTGDRLTVALRTPRSALETFLAAGEAGRWWEAAGALNLSDLPMSERRDRGLVLAEQLHAVIERRLDIDWRDIPDRADGAWDGSRPFGVDADAKAAPTPRHNLLIGSIAGGTPPTEIRLERVEPPGMPPVWLIARSTVRSIDALYERHGPGWLERVAPTWMTATFGTTALWQWLGFLLLVVVSFGVGFLLQRLATRLLRSSERRRFRALSIELARPLTVLASVATLWLTSSTLLTLSGAPGRWVSTALAALLIGALTWLGMITINFLSEYVAKQQVDRLADADGVRARRHRTYLSVARRVFIFVILLLGLGLVLAQFDMFRTFGTSLLASAGVAGIVLGIAAQGTLSNIMAGIQIALTQLVRIGDAVVFEGDRGTVEDITYTFVVIRTWDHRRIAVPNRHIIAHPIENWEMNARNMIIPVILHVDYLTPIHTLRQRYVAVLEAAEDWDREQEPRLDVLEATADVLRLRVLCSAEDAMKAWRLHCHVREELVAFLQTWDDGRYLPRSRVHIGADGEARGAVPTPAR